MLDWLIRVARGRRPAINASSHQVARQVEAMTAEMEAMDDTRLRRFARSLAYRARAGEPLEDLVVDSFAATREAARRKLGMRHYDVQLLAGEALVRGAIVEMQTGEGKTLVATLPLALFALAGRVRASGQSL